MLRSFKLYNQPLSTLNSIQPKYSNALLITTINAHSYNVASIDGGFAEALRDSDVLLPDGISVVWAAKMLNIKNKAFTSGLKKIAGEDLFYYEMKRLHEMSKNNGYKPVCLFLGSSEATLDKIKMRAAVEFPSVSVHTYSPPYKPEFDENDNEAMILAINSCKPDVLFVGMTAPKQEKWAYRLVNPQPNKGSNESEIQQNNSPLGVRGLHICCIGAVFDFYAGTVKRAPVWIIRLGLEWLYRLLKEPRRMWRRYLVGNFKFLKSILLEAIDIN